MMRAAHISAPAPPRDAGVPPRHPRIRTRGRTAVCVPQARRAVARVRLDRRGRRERVRAALPGRQRGRARRRPDPDRRRVRTRRLRVGHHAHVPGQRALSLAQRTLYDIVLAAQQAAIDATRAGVPFEAPHDAAVRVLAQGLLDTGIIPKSRFERRRRDRRARLRTLYMHRTGHWIGMDVHDCGDYRERLSPSVTATARCRGAR